MSYLSECMDAFFASSKPLAFTTENHVRKFVAYIEELGGTKADRLKSITEEDIKGCVGYCHSRESICSVNSLDNHLNALKSFYTFLNKDDRCGNLFHTVKDWGDFRQGLIDQYNLIEARPKDYLLNEDIINLLDYFNSHPDEYPALAIFCKLMLVAPAKRTVIANLSRRDFSSDYRVMNMNGVYIELPVTLSKSITHIMRQSKPLETTSSIFAQMVGREKFKGETFNNQLYYALQKSGYAVPKDKNSFAVETIRISAILNLASQNVNLYAISKVAGITIQRVWNLVEKYAEDTAKAKISQQIQDGVRYCSYYEFL